MRQLARRLQRLESTGTFVDVHRSFNRLVHEAALEVDLPPPVTSSSPRPSMPGSTRSARPCRCPSRMSARSMRWCARSARRCVPSWIPSWTNPSALASMPPVSEGCRREARRRGAQG